MFIVYVNREKSQKLTHDQAQAPRQIKCKSKVSIKPTVFPMAAGPQELVKSTSRDVEISLASFNLQQRLQACPDTPSFMLPRQVKTFFFPPPNVKT